MKLSLKHWRVNNLSFVVKDEVEDTNVNTFNLNTSKKFSEQENSNFHVDFDISICDEQFDISIEATFEFQTDEPITEEFKISDFPKVNAPAIAFPYLRAYISNLTLQSGFNPIILPSINFVKMAKNDNGENSIN